MRDSISDHGFTTVVAPATVPARVRAGMPAPAAPCLFVVFPVVIPVRGLAP